jgi:hypothetical protein
LRLRAVALSLSSSLPLSYDQGHQESITNINHGNLQILKHSYRVYE